MTAEKRSLRDYAVVEGSFALILALPLAVVLAHRAYAPIAAVMAVIAATRLTSWVALRSLLAPPRRLSFAPAALGFSLAALVCWIAVTGIWSPTPGALAAAAGTGVSALAVYLIVAEIRARDSADARRIAAAFAIACLLALVLLFFEARTGGFLRLTAPPADVSPDRFKDITGLGRGFAALLPSLFSAAAIAALVLFARASRRTLALGVSALFAIAFSAALDLTIAANSAGVLVGTGAALLAAIRPRATLTVLTLVFCVALVLAPALLLLPVEAIVERAAGVLPVSWLQRLYIWRHLAGEALACLPLGCGADYARSLAAAGQTFVLPGYAEPLRLVPLHPHSVFLQIWLELGLPGVALGVVAILAGGRLARDAALPRSVAAALAGGAAATFVYWSVEASIWQEWRLGSIILAAAGIALCANLCRSQR